MSVAIRKLEGVESASVSLKDGVAHVTLKPANGLDLERIRGVAWDNGFTPKGAEIEILGRIVEVEGGRALAVTGSDVVYRLMLHDEAAPAARSAYDALSPGQDVGLSGHVAESPQRATPERRLRVRALRAGRD